MHASKTLLAEVMDFVRGPAFRASSIANVIKQHLRIKYFLGNSENAVKYSITNADKSGDVNGFGKIQVA